LGEKEENSAADVREMGSFRWEFNHKAKLEILLAGRMY